MLPKPVRSPIQFRTPSLRVRRGRLVEPADVRPPKAALLGARDILGRIGVRVMVPVVCDPSSRRTGAVQNGPENQQMLDRLIQPEGAVRQQTVVADRRTQTSQSD